ncbi:hypothetical protein [Streptomyces chromofuscus]|uniref:Uncharacterized protein n=1 Tax=Streptomyces chromofuscus TaxID=42881 RepID=A0A7M2T8A7_STRCW|nr:hypothetical protein [Streptomyces chromofuscus]QOV44937.1 hypothetical protein IPT68_02735 [Streptomyces chromofuscus]GGT36600.1 hypothetical protein GCM10010254_66060 [Streptomyces chromofuscus]
MAWRPARRPPGRHVDPRHVEIADGRAYVADKSCAGEGGADLLTRIDLKH